MRFTFSSLLAAVSMAALVAVSANAAASKAENFGTLKSEDIWRVGTIDSDGAPYCAMVNKYQKGVFLAFARDAAGYGSIALDFSEDKFVPGTNYEASLTPDKAKASKFEAQASSERSVVVQVGKDDAFYKSLNKADTLHVSLSMLNVSFAMAPFASSYQELVDCAGHLNGDGQKVATKVDPSQSPLTVPAETGTKVASAEPALKAMEEDLKKEQKIETEQSNAAINWFDDKKEDLGDKLAAEKQAAADLQQEKTGVERKLLASTSASPAARESAAPVLSGKSVQELEKEQLAAIKSRPPVKDTSKSATSSTALLIEKRVGDTSSPVDGVSAKETSVTKVEKTKEEKTQVAAADKKPEDKKAEDKKPVVADAAAEKAREAAIQKDFDKFLADAPETSMPLSPLEQKLADAEKARTETDGKLKKLFSQKEQNSDEVARLRRELADKTAARDKIQAEIDKSKPAPVQMAAAEATFEDMSAASVSDMPATSSAKMSAPPEMPDAKAPVMAVATTGNALSVPPDADPALDAKYAKLNDDLAQKQSAIAQMEAQMKEVEAARAAEAERAAKAQADLDQARQQIEKMKKGEKPTQMTAAEKAIVTPPTPSLKQMPAVPSKPVAQEIIGAPAVQPNRAAAFLDKIMTYHRPAGVSASSAPVKSAPVAVPTEDEKSFMAVLNAKPITARPAAPVEAPKAPAVVAAKAPEPMPAPVPAPVAEPVVAPAPAAISAPPVMAAAVKPEVKTPDKPPAEKISAPLLSEPPAQQVVEPSAEMQKMIAEVAEEPPVENVTEQVASKPEEKKNEEKVAAKPVKEEKPVEKVADKSAEKTPASEAPIDLTAGLPVPPASQQPPVAAAPAPVKMPAPAKLETEIAQADLSLPPSMPPAVLPSVAAAEETGKISSPPDMPKRAPVSVAMTSPMDMPAATPEKPPVVEKPVALSAKPEAAPVPAPEPEPEPMPIPAPVAAAPEPIPQPQPAPAAAPSGVATLESLLQQPGQQNVRFIAVNSGPGEAVRQWKAGNLNGLYEQTADGGGNFNAAMQNYLDRYREDCPGHLDVTVGEIRTLRAGVVAPAAISCKASSNAYSTSFVFVQDAGKFNAIAHSGRPNQTAEVKAASDKLIGNLVNAQRFTPPEPTIKAEVAPVAPPPAHPVPQAEVVPAPASVAAPEILADPSGVTRLQPPQAAAQPQKQLRFRMFDKADTKHPGDEFATVVIE